MRPIETYIGVKQEAQIILLPPPPAMPKFSPTPQKVAAGYPKDPIYRLPGAGRKVHYQTPDVIVGERTRRIEKQIHQVYETAPFVPKYDPGIVAASRMFSTELKQEYYRQPTKEQAEKIVLLAKQLPKEKRAKYIYEPPPPPTWKEVTVAGQIETKGLYGAIAEWLSPLLPEHKRKGYIEFWSGLPEPRGIPIAPRTVAGLIAGPESYYRWVRGEPTPPLPSSALIGAALGRTETLREFEATSPEYQMGALMYEVGEAYAIGKGASKAWQFVRKAPIVVRAAHKVRFSRLARISHRAATHIRFMEPIYTIRTLPRRAATFYTKHFTKVGRLERALAWGEKGFLQPMAFETWATVKEAHKFAGYPVLYGKYTGFAVIQVPRLTAYQQIMKAIEAGKFPAAGGMSAQQIALFEKQQKAGWTGAQMVFTVPMVRQGSRLVPLLFPKGVTRPRRKAAPSLVLFPKIEPISFELEREKTRPLIALKPDQVQEQLPGQMLKQPVLLKQKTIQVHRIPVPTIPKTPTLTFPPPLFPRFPGGPGRRTVGRDMFGRWFKKEHPIPTAKEMAKRFKLIPDKPRKRKKEVSLFAKLLG